MCVDACCNLFAFELQDSKRHSGGVLIVFYQLPVRELTKPQKKLSFCYVISGFYTLFFEGIFLFRNKN